MLTVYTKHSSSLDSKTVIKYSLYLINSNSTIFWKKVADISIETKTEMDGRFGGGFPKDPAVP